MHKIFRMYLVLVIVISGFLISNCRARIDDKQHSTAKIKSQSEEAPAIIAELNLALSDLHSYVKSLAKIAWIEPSRGPHSSFALDNTAPATPTNPADDNKASTILAETQLLKSDVINLKKLGVGNRESLSTLESRLAATESLLRKMGDVELPKQQAAEIRGQLVSLQLNVGNIQFTINGNNNNVVINNSPSVSVQNNSASMNQEPPRKVGPNQNQCAQFHKDGTACKKVGCMVAVKVVGTYNDEMGCFSPFGPCSQFSKDQPACSSLPKCIWVVVKEGTYTDEFACLDRP